MEFIWGLFCLIVLFGYLFKKASEGNKDEIDKQHQTLDDIQSKPQLPPTDKEKTPTSNLDSSGFLATNIDTLHRMHGITKDLFSDFWPDTKLNINIIELEFFLQFMTMSSFRYYSINPDIAQLFWDEIDSAIIKKTGMKDSKYLEIEMLRKKRFELYTALSETMFYSHTLPNTKDAKKNASDMALNFFMQVLINVWDGQYADMITRYLEFLVICQGLRQAHGAVLIESRLRNDE